MKRTFTTNTDVLNSIKTMRIFVIPTFRQISFLLFFCTIFACSEEQNDSLSMEAEQVEKATITNKTYKGIFATKESGFRGTFDLVIANSEGSKSPVTEGIGTLSLHTGEIIEARTVTNKESFKTSDFNAAFDSEDLSFNFFLDELGNPQVNDVIYKKEEGSIVIAESSAKSSVTPITGIYKCLNCQDQTASYNGIKLNNDERTFNLLLTTADGTSKMSIQAVLGDLIDTEILLQESCSSTGEFTFCEMTNEPYSTNEDLVWTGVHRFNTEALTEEENCSVIFGTIDLATRDFGSIKAEFISDNACPTNTYYVSPTGNDGNTGISPQDAWQTISRVNSVDLTPGDRVLFEGNNSYDGSIYLDSNDANNSSNLVTISSYGAGKATIKSGLKDGLFAYNTAGIKIDNMIFSGTAITSNENSGIRFYNDLPGNTKLNSVEVTNCEVFGYRDSGIVIGAWNGNSGFNDVLIENNKVHDILDAGISSFGYFSQTKTGYSHSNITVRNCEVYNIPGYDKGNNSGNGIVLSDVQHSVIEHCTAYNSGNGNAHSSGGPVGIWYWDADQVTIQYNEVYGMASGTNKDGGGFDLDGGVTNGVMQYNYSHDNEGAGFLIGQFRWARPMDNITVRYNISENDAATNGGSVYLFNGEAPHSMKNIYVHNNTLYNAKQTSYNSTTVKFSWNAVMNNINIFNNIFIAENGADFIEMPEKHDADFLGNLYYTTGTFNIRYKGVTYNSLDAFRNTGQETLDGLPVGHDENPQLTAAGEGGTIGFGNRLTDLAAYKLQSGSPAINAGVNIALGEGTQDFYGTMLELNASPDIGAHAEIDTKRSSNNDIASK